MSISEVGITRAILDAYTTQCLNKVLLKVKHLRDKFGKKGG